MNFAAKYEIQCKWSQMIVTGKTVTRDQVNQIILRTDTNLSSVHENILKVMTDEQIHDNLKLYFSTSGLYDLISLMKHTTPDPDKFRMDLYELVDTIQYKMGYIETEYVFNNWVDSSFIFGAHGWCHPDGTIGFIDNVGKYPSTDDIYNEWVKIAAAFPFLDIHVTMMNGEQCETDTKPIFNLRVLDGKVELIEPDLTVHGDTNTKREYVAGLLDLKNHNDRRCAIDVGQMMEIATIMYDYTDSYLKRN